MTTTQNLTFFTLCLNNVRVSIEQNEVFGPFPTREAAIIFHNSELVTQYHVILTDKKDKDFSHHYDKYFREGGPLEWSRPLRESEKQVESEYGQGIYESTQSCKDWEELKTQLRTQQPARYNVVE